MKKPTAVLITTLTIIGRLIPHPANFTTLGAGVLFGGSKISRPWNYILPATAMLITDFVIGLHGTMLYVYGAILISVWVGERTLKDNPTTGKLTVIAVLNSTIFFILTNFGVWASTTMYAKNFTGLIQSYTMGLPFWRNMMLADVIFTVGFFSLYSFAEKKKLISLLDKNFQKIFYTRWGVN